MPSYQYWFMLLIYFDFRQIHEAYQYLLNTKENDSLKEERMIWGKEADMADK